MGVESYMIEYVNGFLFDRDRIAVVLVHKKKPAWQAGYWNAVGGKKEPGETWLDAIIREFEEETGVHITEWEHTITLWGPPGPSLPEWELRFFRAFSTKAHRVRTVEEETIKLIPLTRLGHVGFVSHKKIIPNLGWAIPLSLDDHIDFPVIMREK